MKRPNSPEHQNGSETGTEMVLSKKAKPGEIVEAASPSQSAPRTSNMNAPIMLLMGHAGEIYSVSTKKLRTLNGKNTSHSFLGQISSGWKCFGFDRLRQTNLLLECLRRMRKFPRHLGMPLGGHFRLALFPRKRPISVYGFDGQNCWHIRRSDIAKDKKIERTHDLRK